MGTFKILLTLAMVTTALSLPTLPTPLKPEGAPDRPAQPAAHASPDVAVSVEPKSPGESKQGERLEGVRSVSNDPSLTTKKQSASDGAAVQATQHVDTHDTSGKDSVVQLKKSVKLNNDESPALVKDEAKSETKDTVSHDKPLESPNVELGNDASTASPSADKPQEPAKPLKGIIEDVRDFGTPNDAVELPKDVTLSDDNRKAHPTTTDDEQKPTDKVESTPMVHDVPNTELTPGHLESTNTNADVTRQVEYAVTEDGKKSSEASTVTPHEVTTLTSATHENRPGSYHKISKREDTKHDYEKDTIAHAISNTGSPKTKVSKSDVSKPAHVKMDAHKSTKPHTKTIQETADEMKPTGFKTSREIASPDTPEINAQEIDIAEAKQSPDTVVSGASQVDPATQVSPVVSPASAPQAAVPTADAETPQDKPSTSTTNTAKNQTATTTESGGGFNPFGPIRSVFQPIIDAAASVRDQIRPVIGAALSPVLGPLSPGKGGAAQNASATTVEQPSASEGSATSPASPTGDEEPHRETQTVVPADTASLTTVQDSAAPEVRTDETGAATDAKTVALPALEVNRNGSQTPPSPFPVPFDPIAAINRFTKPAVEAATNVRDQVRPVFEAAVAPIVDALNPTKEATDSNTPVGSAEPQLRASDDMPEIAAEEPVQPHKRRYSNYKLFSVYIGNDTTTLDVISALRENMEVDFWSAPTLNRNVSILIPPELVEKVQNILKNAGIEFHVITDDIQRIAFGEKTDLVVGEDAEVSIPTGTLGRKNLSAGRILTVPLTQRDLPGHPDVYVGASVAHGSSRRSIVVPVHRRPEARHKLVRAYLNSMSSVELLRNLQTNNTHLDFWDEPVSPDQNVTIRLPPSEAFTFEKRLELCGIHYTVLTENLQE
ncbi:hypothetical protein HPB49_021873 [Dermacentor silvarum]|uniref:Uncharacterized protein n=1 Tax=Dermacentor silvarum TaxID=543639 RepID=A0ACB8E3L0_DERSI|nr:hypothetical protein HPB49_021873 [Dermacentor silvarum]